MDKTTLTVGLLASFSVGMLGCDDSSDSAALRSWADALEGIYRVDAMTQNPTSCDAEGASTLADRHDHMLIFLGQDPFGLWLMADGCADASDCRARLEARRANRGLTVTFSYQFREASPDALRGTWITTGYWSSDGICTDGSVTDIELTRPTETQVRIEARAVVVDHPADAEGICWTSDTQSAAAGKPCNLLDVVQTTWLEPL